MNGASCWEERERAKADALKMAARLSAREKGLVVAAARRGLANDAARDQTRQRRFERSFLSLDRPDADGDLYDYGDCGREVRRMMRALDAPYRERVRDLRFRAALGVLDGHPELQRALRAIRRHRRRKEVAAALGVSPETYAKRFARLCGILGFAP